MISPHCIARERSLFMQALERDRERRRLGLPEPESPDPRRLPAGNQTLMQSLEMGSRAVVQAHVFSGGR